MKNLDEIKNELQEHKQTLKDEYGVTALGVFGSYACGEQTEKSDIDILVDLEEPIGLVRLVRLSRDISRMLGIRTDLTTKNALKPHIGERVLQEVQYV